MDKLRSYLDQTGLSHEAFGKIVGVTQVTINRYVRGDRFPSPEMILKISKATKGEVSVTDWYASIDASPKPRKEAREARA